MDDFVRDKLTEWGLREWIEKFKEEGFTKESFFSLEDQNEEIEKLIPKIGPRCIFKRRLKLLMEQNTANPDTADASAQVIPSTSGRSNEVGKRKSDLQGESNQQQPPTKKRRPGSYSEKKTLTKVKDIMRRVLQRIPPEKNNLNDFLRRKIHDLETEEREVVGVFGKTGAGKSSLINAIIGLKNFLPSGSVSACTSVLIKVEANMQNQKGEAIVEFITKEEWRDELWFSKNFGLENGEDDTEHRDIVEKLSALYGEDWKEKSPDDLMDGKYFKKIPEFLQSNEELRKKILTADEDEELFEKLIRYTRSNPDDAVAQGTRRWYWPLVKCVTIKVPDADLLKHVTLVDLPGNGDSNKSRDNMWKTVVGSCSTIWIVTDINRAASDKEAWDILKDACSYMGNGGQCNEIHFICTKSDGHSDAKDTSEAGIRDFILKRNQQAKDKVMKEFNQLKEVKKHFSEESFKVFTVSSVEFLNQKYLNQEETEIPKLQEFLQELNDCHKETLNYVSGAHGILSLIQGASRRGRAEKKKAVCTILETKMKDELQKVRKQMEETYEDFEKCLNDGVEESEKSCERFINFVLNPKSKSGSGFHKTLKYLVEHNGIYNAKTTKSKKKRKQNLNMELSSFLTQSIDEIFKETFPNEVNCGPFKGKLNSFSLGTKEMKMEPEYEDVKLQLEFLNAEEDKMKKKLIKVIRERKKRIYSSLMTTVEESMQKCYDDAKVISGTNSLNNMRETIRKHVQDSKNIMFKNAKKVMLNQLRDLMKDMLEDLTETMQESIDLSLKTDGDSIPDVTVELGMVKNHHEELKGSAEEDQ
ncbi:nuclear GTPase SLIP-GC-like isoform X4 [Pungitius pungitius]|uniref:nuclear GTPase SLIP-GC-like isoform X4 n=1 Tax=Pungitius pungitius TaxID=134920 RepID=UPI002E11173A